MSSDSTVKALEIAESGFTIAKQISRKGGEHIQVDLEITSTHDKQSTLNLEEAIPPGTDQSQIGFLPNSEPREWDIADDGRLRLQARLVAQGTRQIVYGIRDIESDDIEHLSEETRIIGVGGPAGEDVEVDADVEYEPADSEPPAEDDADATAAATEAEDTETADTAGAPESADSPAAGEVVTDGASAEAAGPAAIDGDIDEETAEELAATLAPHIEDHIELDALTETKIAQLQEDVSDIRGYLPAFEEFLGDTGRADDILDELEELRAAVDDMDDAPEDLENTIDQMDERLASIEETAEEFDAKLEEIIDRLDSLEGWREEIAAASSN